MNKSSNVSLIVLALEDDNVEVLNSILRGARHPVHCRRISALQHLKDAVVENTPQVILIFADEANLDLQTACNIAKQHCPKTPVIAVSDLVNETTITDAMRVGARDVVSLGNTERLVFVFERELRSFDLEHGFEDVMMSAKRYKQELHNLTQGVTEAIADIQEGIVVAANPAWIEMFGCANKDNLIGTPAMDLFAEDDQQVLRGALAACLKNKWDNSKLRINGCKQDKKHFGLELLLEAVSFDNEPAVRAIVAIQSAADQVPEELLESSIQRDPVTGFYHRHYFLSKANERISESLEGGVRAIIYLRPDKFSNVHEDIGLLGTEQILIQFSQVLSDYMQTQDLYGRFGGTQFTAIIERGSMAEVEKWAEQLRKALAEKVFEHEDRSTTLTCSIGLLEIDSAETPIEDLLIDVEIACRAARDSGGNAVQVSQITMDKQQTLEADEFWSATIRSALMENRLRLIHQPVASLNEDIDNVHDTLVRIIDNDGNTVLPSEFMPAAERTGLTKNIDRWVIGASISFVSATQPKMVFIRLSRQSVVDETSGEWILETLKNSSIDPHQICFQLNEGIAIVHLRQVQSLAEQLRSAGCSFALDHFGGSDNSLRFLSHVPMDFIKLDGSIMPGLHKDKELQEKIMNMNILAQGKGIKTIAEQVQNANTMAILWQLGVAYMQGNYVEASEVTLEDTNTGMTLIDLPAIDEDEAKARIT